MAKKNASKRVSTATKRGAQVAHAPRSTTAAGPVRIRIYRQGLGDCFLLRFTRNNGKAFHVVIDCGVLTGSPDGRDRIRKVVENIAAETGGKIDLLVATHEHTDHLSGFNTATDLWDGMTIRKTWMAWTENLSRQEVKDLKTSQRLRLRAALAGQFRLEDRSVGVHDETQRNKLLNTADGIYALMQFALDEDDAPDEFLAAGADAKMTGPARALNWLKEKAGASIEFCHPADLPRALDGLVNIKVFVLGPPTGPLLRHGDPGSGEAYELFGGLTSNDLSFALAAAESDESSLDMMLSSGTTTRRSLVRRSGPIPPALSPSTSCSGATPGRCRSLHTCRPTLGGSSPIIMVSRTGTPTRGGRSITTGSTSPRRWRSP